MNRTISINVNIPTEQLEYKDLDIYININPQKEDASLWDLDEDDLKQ